MSKLIKGSKAAKAFMAKIRAKKSPKKSAKKVSGVKESAKLKKELAAKKLRLPHGYETIKRTRKKKKLSGVHKDTKSHNVKISVMSGVHKNITEEQILNEIQITRFNINTLLNQLKKHNYDLKRNPYTLKANSYMRANLKDVIKTKRKGIIIEKQFLKHLLALKKII